MTDQVRTVGVLGAGRVGSAIARQALKAGYDVLIAASGPATDIELLVDLIVPGAVAVTAAEAAAQADVVVLAVPLNKYRTLPVEALAHKIVIDAMNHWAPVDGYIAEFDNAEGSTSEIVEAFLPDSTIVKTLNHIGYHELEEDGRPARTPGRRALAIAGDDPAARKIVADVIDRFGFDTIEAGRLADGAFFETGTSIFNGRFNRADLETELELAVLERSGNPDSLATADR